MERKRHTILSTVFVVLLSLAVTQIMGGCRSVKYVEVPTVKTEYITKTDTMMKRDSIFVKDSVVIAKDGDTVMIDRWHTLLKDRLVYKTKIDTVIKNDSTVEYVDVPAELSKWQKWKIGFADFMLLIIGICVIIVIVQQIAYKYFK